MFKDFLFEKFYNYTLIDSNFTETGKIKYTHSDGAFVRMLNTCVDAYEEKNIPVIPNLIAILLWYKNEWGFDINDVLSEWADSDKYLKYKLDFEKLLILF